MWACKRRRTGNEQGATKPATPADWRDPASWPQEAANDKDFVFAMSWHDAPDLHPIMPSFCYYRSTMRGEERESELEKQLQSLRGRIRMLETANADLERRLLRHGQHLLERIETMVADQAEA